MNSKTIEECLPQLVKHPKVMKLARSFGFETPEELLSLNESYTGTEPTEFGEFIDGLVDLLSEEEEHVDFAEVEILSSYTTTSTFILCNFSGVYWIENFEMGGVAYFLSEKDAKLALKEERGIEWDSPESPFSTVDELPPDPEDE